jgi:hypothetical protein
MPKFRLIATGAGGKPVAEIVVEKTGREQALTEGIAELLLLDKFPPDAVQLYREAIGRGYERVDVCDTLMEKFNLQFWCDPVKDDTPAPAQAETFAPTTSTAPVNSTVPVQSTRTPRQIIRDELKRLNSAMKASKRELDQIKARYDDLKGRRDECRQLLTTPPPKVPSGKRKLQSV